jgi:hypothetical protein
MLYKPRMMAAIIPQERRSPLAGAAARLGAAARKAIPQKRDDAVPYGDVIALAAVASLFIRGDRLTLFSVGSAAVGVQDILLLATLAAWLYRPRLARGQGVTLLLLALFAAFLVVAVTHAAEPKSAAESVAKLAEFTIGGFAAFSLLRASHLLPFVTVVLAAGVAINALYAALLLLADGGVRALFTSRSDGLLGTETLATVAGCTLVWCYARSAAATTAVETWAIRAGFVGALAALAATKSFMGAAAVVALVFIAPALDRRVRRATVAVVVVLGLIVVVTRAADIEQLTGRTATSAVAPGPDLREPVQTAGAILPAVTRLPLESASGSIVHRLALAHMGVRLVEDKPIWGHGWLSTQDADFLASGPYDKWMLERFPDLSPLLLVSNGPTHVHNAPLQIAAEAGVLAAIVFLLILVYATARAIVAVFAGRQRTDWALVAAAGWLVVLFLFFQTNALFGGTLENALLGGALALASGRRLPRLTPVSAGVALAVTAVLLGIGAALVLSSSDAETPVGQRVRVVDTALGAEVWRAGHVFGAPKQAVVANDLVELRFDAEGPSLELQPRAGGPGTLRLSLGPEFDAGAAAVAVVRRTADFVVVGVTPHGDAAEPVLVGIVRGVPGAYVFTPYRGPEETSVGAAGGGRRLVLAGEAVTDVSSAGRAGTWSVGPRSPAVSLGGDATLVPLVVPFHPASITTRSASDEPGLFAAYATDGARVTFVGPVPLEGSGNATGSAPLRIEAPGTYVELDRSGDDWTKSAFVVEDGGQSVRAGAAYPRYFGSPFLNGVDETLTLAAQLCPPGRSFQVALLPRKDRTGHSIEQAGSCTSPLDG